MATSPTPHTDLAQAIAQAEGFAQKGAIPTIAHNPGDLVCPWLSGAKLGVEGVHVFEDDAAGWAALEYELDLIKTHRSKVYEPSMTLIQMAAIWTRTQSTDWANNVVAWFTAHDRLITINTKIQELLS